MQTNRSFLYGESVFTTAMLMHGKVLFLNKHLDRLISGADFLWGRFSDSEKEALKNRILHNIPQNTGHDGLRVTLSYQDSDRKILRNGFESSRIHIDYLSFPKGDKKSVKLKSLKTSNEQNLLPTFLKNSRRAQQTISLYRSGFLNDEESVLFCGPNEEVFETSWANIFAVKDNILYTPPCGGSVLSGIMRDKILSFDNHKFDEVKEELFTLSWLKSCDFVFVTNALWGVLPVEQIDATKFNRPIEDFFEFEKVILDEEVGSEVSYM